MSPTVEPRGSVVSSRALLRCELPIAAFLVVIALYGMVSLPGLWRRWGGPSLAALPIAVFWILVAVPAWSLAHRPPRKRLLLVLASVLVLARIAAAIPFAGRVAGGDALYYPLLAENLLRGRGLEVFEPFMGNTVHALFPPFFPLLLALWKAAFGLSTPSLSALNLLIDAGTAWLMFRLATRLGMPGAGRAAAWLYLIWPSVLLSAPVAQKEGLVALLVLTLVHAWFAAAATPVVRNMAAVGLSTTLLALTQPALVPLSALLGLCFFAGRYRHMPRVALGAIAIATIAMMPWWLRNGMLLHQFVPLTTSGGTSLWIGNNPHATGNWLPEPYNLRGLSEIAYSKAAAAMAWAWIEQHPYDFARLTIEKLFRAMASGQAEVARLRDTTPHPNAHLGQAIFPLAQLSHILLLAGAAFTLLHRGKFQRIGLVALVMMSIAQILLFNIWFEFSERHREFMTPILLLLVSTALESINVCPATKGSSKSDVGIAVERIREVSRGSPS